MTKLVIRVTKVATSYLVSIVTIVTLMTMITSITINTDFPVTMFNFLTKHTDVPVCTCCVVVTFLCCYGNAKAPKVLLCADVSYRVKQMLSFLFGDNLRGHARVKGPRGISPL